MSDESTLLNYHNIADSLEELNIPLSSAEAHGIINGLICAGHNEGQVIQNLLAQGEPGENSDVIAEHAKDDLRGLIQLSSQQLADTNFSLHLLLPDDEQPLTIRTKALGLWAHGFLIGLGEGGFQLEGESKDDQEELIKNITAISQIDSYNIENDDEDEEVHFTELAEFLRVAVLTIYCDCMKKNIEARKTPASSTIH